MQRGKEDEGPGFVRWGPAGAAGAEESGLTHLKGRVLEVHRLPVIVIPHHHVVLQLGGDGVERACRQWANTGVAVGPGGGGSGELCGATANMGEGAHL